MTSFTALMEQAKTYYGLMHLYCQLSSKPSLSQADEERLDGILAISQANPLVSFLIDEVDHMLGHLQNLIDKKVIGRQQHLLRQRIDQVWLEQIFQDLNHQAQAERCTRIQCYLKAQGYYPGTIDGIMGPVTQRAIQQYCKQPLSFPSLNGSDAMSC